RGQDDALDKLPDDDAEDDDDDSGYQSGNEGDHPTEHVADVLQAQSRTGEQNHHEHHQPEHQPTHGVDGIHPAPINRLGETAGRDHALEFEALQGLVGPALELFGNQLTGQENDQGPD